MRAYLLDTNHLGQAVRESAVHSRMKREVTSGVRVGTCVPVLCEIASGTVNVKNTDEYNAGLREALRSVRV